MIFFLSASGKFLSSELLSGVFLSNELSLSHLVARYTLKKATLYFNVLLITSCGVQAGGHLLKRALGV